MTIQDSLSRLLKMPTPKALWDFKEALIIAGISENSSLVIITDQFYDFVNELVAKSSAREFSHFASIMDIAAVAGVALENLVGGKEEPNFWMRFGMAAFSETMMVMAARQYVKAWEVELKASYNAAGWFLSQEFWKLSKELQPQMIDEKRRTLVNELISPIHSEDVDGNIKAGVIVRLFQLLLSARYLLSLQKL